MTLCKYRPMRTYDAQFIYDQHDVKGLLKVLGQMVDEMGEDGLESTHDYAIAHLTLSTLFDENGLDMWTEFVRNFEEGREKLQGGES